MATELLSAKQVENAKPRDKVYRLADGAGLYLEVHPAGGRYWRGKYRIDGREKRSAYGVFPTVGLADARKRHRDMRAQLAQGIDPGAVRKQSREVERAELRAKEVEHLQRFDTIAEEWLALRRKKLASVTADKSDMIVRTYLVPGLGKLDVRDVTAPVLLVELRKVEARGILEILSRARRYASSIFRYAIATGRAAVDPAEPLKEALETRKAKNHAALKPDELGELVKRIGAYDSVVVRLALQLALLTSVRTIELRGAEWSEIDLQRAEWTVPAERMKTRQPHWLPLSTQAVAVLNELQPITGRGRLLFPNERNAEEWMSENTMLYALYRCGYHKRSTVHGFRAAMSTAMNDAGFADDIIERQLAHRDPDQVRRIYNRAEYVEKRRELAQAWANMLERLAALEAR